MIVTDDECQSAWAFLRGAGRTNLQKWTTEQSRLDHRRHVVLAIMTAQSAKTTQGAREMEARKSNEYQEHIEQLAIAEGELAAIRSAIKDARDCIELWRTQQADQRAAARVA